MTRLAGIIKMKWYNITYFIREAGSSIAKHRFMSVAAVSVIAACLLIMGSFLLVAVNIESMLQEVENQNEIVAFIDEKLPEGAAASVESQICSLPNVNDVKYTSKEQALTQFRQELGEDSDLLDGLDGDNPLRSRFSITLSDIKQTSQTAQALREIKGITDVSARSDISDKIIQVRSVVTAICLILIIVLLAVAIFIISNTVNLTIFNRREEIAIMKMVGAKNGFVRSPFIIEGLILGIIGAVLALLLEWGLYAYVAETVLQEFNLFHFISFGDIVWKLAAVFAGVGALVGGAGSAITMRKFLKV